MITIEDFENVEMRVGRILTVDEFPKARKPAYKLTIDFGEFGVKRSSAQITAYYDRTSLLGREVIAVTNFPPRQIADFLSEVLVLGVVDEEGKVVLLSLDRDVRLGSRVS